MTDDEKPPVPPKVPNMIAKYVAPPYGYTTEDIAAMPEALKTEVGVWLHNRMDGIKMYRKRTDLDIKLCSWYFLSMSFMANRLLPEQMPTTNPPSNPLL